MWVSLNKAVKTAFWKNRYNRPSKRKACGTAKISGSGDYKKSWSAKVCDSAYTTSELVVCE